jgi:predicted anti-sigma-YlaC factor YlaD
VTVTGAGSPACREIRQLLGVYVVGAIDPAERSLVDEHLGSCAACRDELAGLAGLPAMLSRVPAEDVARLGAAVVSLPEPQEPSPELLTALLRKVAARRRTRVWRGAASVAAAAAIAAGGTAAVLNLTGSPAPATWSASAMNPVTHVSAVVDYTHTARGTDMRVRVSGIKAGTTCNFWVYTRKGWAAAGSWTVSTGTYGQTPWYPTSAPVSPSSVHDFRITAAGTGKVLVNIPAP